MKKIIAILLASLLVLTACGSNSNDITKSEESKLTIVTSFFPVYDLTSKIGGDKIDIINLTKTGNAHSFEPSIKDMENISNSDLLIINGAGFESWSNKITESLGDLKVLDLSQNLELISIDDLDESMASEDLQYDPHTWLSVKNPQIMLKTIYDKLVELDPENKLYYEENYQNSISQFKDLETRYDDNLSKLEGKAFVPPHAAFNYLLEGYNIEQIAIEGINSVSEPNAARMKQVVDIMKENEIDTVFYEYGQSDKVANSIASEIGGKVLPISTLEIITQEDIDEGVDYISLLEMNLENLVKAMSE